MRRRVLLAGFTVTGLVVASLAGAPAASAAPAPPHATISGSGSSWAANPMANWSVNARNQGIQVNYTASGSSQGRADFANSSVDFAVADLNYAEAGDPTPTRASTSFPVAAGAVTFVYQVRVGSRDIRNIRLSGATLGDIFRGAVTNWNAPEITADNHGHQVAPDLPIIPVIRSDGSATSYRVTQWFDFRFPQHWQQFSAIGATPFFPSAGGRTVAVAGSDGVATRVRQASSNGAIGYVENSYALNAALPVVAIENPSGHFVAPDAGNVSLALLRATTTSSGTANLRGVYNNPDPRAYPLSYYAYGFVPTATEPGTTSGKRQTEIDFFGYTSCRGQQATTPLGLAPLPLNLTRAGLHALAEIRQADTTVNTRALSLSRCENPTITHHDDGTVSDNLVATVPQPPACSAADAGPCKP